MRHSVRHSPEPEDTRDLCKHEIFFSHVLHMIALSLVVMLLFQMSACVSSSSYRELVAERDALALAKSEVGDRAGHLEVANASLEAERVRLFNDLEDLRVEKEALTVQRAALEQDVMQLSENEGQLSEKLEATSTALTAVSDEVQKLQSTYQGLVNDLETEIQKGAIEIEQLRSGVRVAVSDEILFASGSAKLDPGGRNILEKVARNVSELDYEIDVEGHTDNISIRGVLKKRYPSNWELAGARASSVVRLFEASGIEGVRLKAISRASHVPVASNDDDDGRSMNRRIEIYLRPRETVDLLPAVVDGDAAQTQAHPASTGDDSETKSVPAAGGS